MAWLSPFLLVLGLFLPGALLARGLRHPFWWASGFLGSLLVLFHGVFWAGVVGAPVTLWTVLPVPIVASAAAAWLARRWAAPAGAPDGTPWTLEDRILLVSSGLVCLALIVRCAAAPLLGVDTSFRWDFLAERMLALRSFAFYPPLTATDFKSYFYVDGIPPLVSFANWWVYASVGKHAPRVLSILAAAQYAGALAFTYGAAAAMFSRRAGVFAVAILAASPLVFNASVIEQETGLTTLAIAAMIYFVVTERPWWAAAAAAVCALSREYGWIAVIGGVAALRWRSRPWKEVATFTAIAVALAGPWYIRNWSLTGNPFYSLRLGPFTVNPIHDGILQYYKSVYGWQTWDVSAWLNAFEQLLLLATFQMVAGIPGARSRFRERGFLAVIALLGVATWLQAAGYTSAGLSNAMRVASTAMVALSIAGSIVVETWAKRARWAVVAAIVALQVWTVVQGAVYPAHMSEFSAGKWLESAWHIHPGPVEFPIADGLASKVPRGARVLTDSAYLHSALLPKGIDVVPVWSPEVRFLFTAPPQEAYQRLRAAGISVIGFYPGSLNTKYLLANSPFYAGLRQMKWTVLANYENVVALLELTQ